MVMGETAVSPQFHYNCKKRILISHLHIACNVVIFKELRVKVHLHLPSHIVTHGKPTPAPRPYPYPLSKGRGELKGEGKPTPDPSLGMGVVNVLIKLVFVSNSSVSR